MSAFVETGRPPIARSVVVGLTGLAVLGPIALIVYQSFLDAPFFMPTQFSLDAFRFVFSDPDFWSALWNSVWVALGMVAIAVPLGAAIAFIIVRTDLPGRGFIEPLVLLPVLISPVVIALGFLVAAGPVGFYSLLAVKLIGFVPWNIYSPISIMLIGALTHVPHVYIYTSSALKGIGSDVEEAARSVGASPLRVAFEVSLPMIWPAMLFSAALVFLTGLEMFGLVLVLGTASGFEMLSVYLYKLTNKLGIPSYQLMAAVAVFILTITLPLVMLQRRLLANTGRYVSMGGKASRAEQLPLGRWRWVAVVILALWLIVTIVVPLSGIALRASVLRWGEHVDLLSVLTLDHFRKVFSDPPLVRSIVNSVLIGVVGGALSVACYAAIALSSHRRNDRITAMTDVFILIPRAVPGILAGLAFLWVFLFVPLLTPLRATLFSVWLAYTVVWLAYGTRLISSTLLQVAPELEEAGRSVGAGRGRVMRDVTLPLIRYGLLGSWLLIFMIFEREYSTGVYLLTAGTETIGAMIVSLSEGGAIDVVAALSTVNVALVAVGLAIALRFGVRVR